MKDHKPNLSIPLQLEILDVHRANDCRMDQETIDELCLDLGVHEEDVLDVLDRGVPDTYTVEPYRCGGCGGSQLRWPCISCELTGSPQRGEAPEPYVYRMPAGCQTIVDSCCKRCGGKRQGDVCESCVSSVMKEYESDPLYRECVYGELLPGTADELWEKFRNGWSIGELADQYGLKVLAVSKSLRDRAEPVVREMQADGKTAPEISEFLGCTTDFVYRVKRSRIARRGCVESLPALQ